MTIPDYQTIMLPLLRFAGDKKEHSIREGIDHLSDLFKLSESERKEVLPSGRSYIIDNRVGGARTYLKKAGLAVQRWLLLKVQQMQLLKIHGSIYSYLLL